MTLWQKFWTMLISWFHFPEYAEPVKKEDIYIPDQTLKERKRTDSTKITQYQYDYILEQNALRVTRNKDKGTSYMYYFRDFAIDLNETLGLDKSSNVYAYICNGITRRETLIQGIPLDVEALL